MTLFATNIILVSAAGYAAVYGVPKEEMAQMAEKAVSFAKEKLVDFSAFVKPHVDHMIATATPHLSHMRNEVTAFASDHPTLVSTVAALALALIIACFAFKLFDRCCKGKKESEPTIEIQLPDNYTIGQKDK